MTQQTTTTETTVEQSSDQSNAEAYLNQRIAAAQMALREAEEEQQRLREADRQRDREERITNFRQNFEGYLNDPALQETLGVRFDADQPINPSGYVTPYAAFTVDGAELRIYSNGSAEYRVINPRDTGTYTRVLYEPHVTQIASGILLGIAAYRQREADRKEIEAEEAARCARIKAQKAEKAAPAEQPAEAPAKPVARVIESDHYRHTIELRFSASSAKIAIMHRFGDVEFVELTPHRASDEYSHAEEAEHFTLSREQLALFIDAYTAREAQIAAEDAASQADDGVEVPF